MKQYKDSHDKVKLSTISYAIKIRYKQAKKTPATAHKQYQPPGSKTVN